MLEQFFFGCRKQKTGDGQSKLKKEESAILRTLFQMGMSYFAATTTATQIWFSVVSISWERKSYLGHNSFV